MARLWAAFAAVGVELLVVLWLVGDQVWHLVGAAAAGGGLG